MSEGVLSVREGQVLILECSQRSGAVIFHPPGVYEYRENGNVVQVSYREIAKQAADRTSSGAVWAFPNVFDERGNKMWDVVPINLGLDLESHRHAQKCADESLKGTGVTAVVLPACVRVVGVK